MPNSAACTENWDTQSKRGKTANHASAGIMGTSWKSISSKAGAWAEMLELLVPNAAKAIMAERHRFLESGSWENATSIERSNA